MKITVLLAATLLLSACAAQSTPPITLDQKLSQATSPTEQKETLRLACLNEAEWPVRSVNNPYHGRHASQRRQEQLQRNPEVREMKSLCRQMDDLATPDAEKKLSSTQLAQMCKTIVQVKMQKGQTEHAERIQHICNEMTQKK